MNSLLERVHKAPLLADGAMGTLLYARGVPIDHCLETLVVEQPQMVIAIHQEYARAGADIVTTHSFGANRLRLARYGLQGHVQEFNRKAVELARAAQGATDRQLLIAGNVGPVGKRLDWNNQLERKEVAGAFEEQLGVLTAAEVDFLLFETFSDLKELELAVQIARQMGESGNPLPIVASMSYGDNGLTLAGQSADLVTKRLLAANVDIVGANCSVGPSQMVDTLRLMHETAPNAPLSVTPNAGLPFSGEDGQFHYPVDPCHFAGYTPTFLELGARLIGGCCGTTPAHIKAIRELLDGLDRS